MCNDATSQAFNKPHILRHCLASVYTCPFNSLRNAAARVFRYSPWYASIGTHQHTSHLHIAGSASQFTLKPTRFNIFSVRQLELHDAKITIFPGFPKSLSFDYNGDSQHSSTTLSSDRLLRCLSVSKPHIKRTSLPECGVLCDATDAVAWKMLCAHTKKEKQRICAAYGIRPILRRVSRTANRRRDIANPRNSGRMPYALRRRNTSDDWLFRIYTTAKYVG